MAHYRKIDTRIWNDEKFRDLSDDGKLAFFFLLTHPNMTSIGVMRGTIPGLGAELGWTAKAFGEAFGEALAKGMARHDEKAAVVWLPKFIRYNPPENPNVFKAWASAVEIIPECDLTREAIQSVKAFAEGLPEAFRKALPEAFRKGMPIQEQKQEQEQTPKAPAKAGYVLPPWVPEESWTAWVAMRKRIKAPLTDAAAPLAITKLDKLRSAGHDVRALIDEATFNCWKSFYPPKASPAAEKPAWAGAK